MKLTLSSKLLIGLLLLLVGSVFATNWLLKKEYDSKSYLEEGKKVLLSQPFSHVKIDGMNAKGAASFYQGEKYEVALMENEFFVNSNSAMDELTATVLNDTLFIKLPTTQRYRPTHFNESIKITAPKIQSITCVDSWIYVSIGQSQLVANAFGNSKIELATYDLDRLNLKMDGRSELSIISDLNKLEVINAQLNGFSKLKMPKVMQIDTMNIQTSDSTGVELSSQMLQKLLKK